MNTFIQQHITKNYKNPDQTKRDVTNVLQHYRNLAPKLDTFVFNDGTQKQFVCLDGTIPVNYKGVIYNIPVCLWILETHPTNAPMVFVKPTPEMQIKVSRHVDHNGRVYLPYLHTWKPRESELTGLVQVMAVIFGEQPPVYAVTKPDNSTPYPTQPSMPLPTPANSGTGITPYPPYPSFGPPYPSSNFPGYPGSNATPYPMPPVPSANYPLYPPDNSNPPYPSTGGGYPPYTPSPVSSAQTSSVSATGTIGEEHIRASLLSAVEDKVRRRLGDMYAQAQAEMETLRRTASELSHGKTKLEDIQRRLESEQAELDKNVNVLKDKERELEDVLSKFKSNDSFDVDEAVVTTAPIYKQLLFAYAEEAAIEDAIYYLGEGLRRGVIDLDVFLKHVRSLSRKQFMLRALMEKCRQQAGLV